MGFSRKFGPAKISRYTVLVKQSLVPFLFYVAAQNDNVDVSDYPRLPGCVTILA